MKDFLPPFKHMQLPQVLILGFRSRSPCWNPHTQLPQEGEMQTDGMAQYLKECAQQRVSVKSHCPESVSSPTVLVVLSCYDKSLTSHLREGVCILAQCCGRNRGPSLAWGGHGGRRGPSLAWGGLQWGSLSYRMRKQLCPRTPAGTRCSNMSQREAFLVPTRTSPSFFLFAACFCLFPQSPSALRGFSLLS